MNDLITIIVNVYNREKFIKRCLDSIVNQTYSNLDILIVNDGSTDGTLGICESYNDSRIRIINQENIGITLSRNVGIDNSLGEYLYFVDSDDFIELDTIEYLYGLIKKYSLDIATSRSFNIYNGNLNVSDSLEKVDIISSEDFVKKILLDKENAVDIWNKLVHKSLYDGLRLEDRIITDMAFVHKLVMRTDKIIYSNQVKYYYYKHKNSITGVKTSYLRMIDIYDVCVERYYYVKGVYPNMIENDVGFLQRMIWLSLKNNKKYDEYLKKQRVNMFNKVFSFRALFYKIGFREKVKIILYRISPKLNMKVINFYLFLVGKKR